MSTKVTLHVADSDMDYARTVWDSAKMALDAVNKVLKDKGVDITFEINDHVHEDLIPDEFFGKDGDWIEVKEE